MEKITEKNRLFWSVVDFITGFIILGITIVFITLFWSRMEYLKQLKSGYLSVNSNGKSKYSKTIPKSWVDYNKIPRKVLGAVIVSEDWAFFTHSGIDFKQIGEALTDTLFEGKKLRGASTISQQLIKNLFYSNRRSYLRKINEAWLTRKLEKSLSKKRILELYVNIIEFGKNLYGIKNASYYYFKKRPEELNGREGAFLAMLLPGPKLYAKSFKDKKLTVYAKRMINNILKKMRVAKYISMIEYERLIHSKFRWEL